MVVDDIIYFIIHDEGPLSTMSETSDRYVVEVYNLINYKVLQFYNLINLFIFIF